MTQMHHRIIATKILLGVEAVGKVNLILEIRKHKVSYFQYIELLQINSVEAQNLL